MAEYRPTDFFHLAVIYIVWGTVYLGMKVGVDGDNAFTPFQLQALRLFLGGSLLALLALYRKGFRGIGPRELCLCVLSAALFWVGGNGLALIAVSELPSGFVAMAMGSIPLWTAVYQVLAERRPPRAPVPLALGFAGLALILWPALSQHGQFQSAPVYALLALAFAPVTWILATAIQPALLARADGVAISSVQLMMGAGMALAIASIEGSDWPHTPSTSSILSLIYLALIGSALSFTSYLKAAAIFPKPIVAAFAYVNPLVGIITGFLILNERPAPISLLGTAIVTISVILTLRKETRRNA